MTSQCKNGSISRKRQPNVTTERSAGNRSCFSSTISVLVLVSSNPMELTSSIHWSLSYEENTRSVVLQKLSPRTYTAQSYGKHLVTGNITVQTCSLSRQRRRGSL